MRAFFLLFSFLVTSSLAFGQQGTLAGKVTDKKTGEGAVGATVLVTGTTQAAPVDVAGNYELALAAGTYSITVTYVGYKTLTFPDVVIRAGAKTTLDAVMAEDATALKEVVVTGVKQTGTEVALIQDLKMSEVVVSGVSNDQIVKSLDRDAAEVVKRIPGVTVQSNNFIVIRGLAERYNTVMLNGALTPSAEVDTRSFSFDILPSSVIDRVLIFKSGSPELPGEFGGGVVQVFTRNSVLENTTTATLSTWVRHGTTFNPYLSSARSGTDWLGFDNGKRQLPDGNTGNEIAPRLANTFAPRTIISRPDLRFSLGLNRKFEIGAKYLSNVTSLSYSNTQERYDVTRQRVELFEQGKVNLRSDYNDNRSLANTRLGLIHNWQLRLNDRNRIDFRNFFNQYGTDEVIHRTGLFNPQQEERSEFATHYQSRSIYSGQLQGQHTAGEAGHTTLTWSGGYNYVFRDEPDYRRYQGQRAAGSTDPFVVQVPLSGAPNQLDAARFYSDLTENTYMLSGQWERRFRGRDTTSVNQYKVRVGFYAEQKARTLKNDYYSYTRDRATNPALLDLPIERIFDPANVGPRGFKFERATRPEDRYDAENDLVAGYIGLVAPLTERLNVTGGVRLEYNRKYLISGNKAEYEEKRFIPMPSLNSTYNFNDRSLLRLAGSISVNRPEFREIAPYVFYDFSAGTAVTGNSKLKTATIYNGDLRYEFYPSRSELLSVGVFYKHFRDAIEQTIVAQGGEAINVSFQNSPTAYDYGVEVEARKSLLGLSESPLLQRINFVLNASLIKSEVTLKDDKKQILNRPLQGQSPYVVNVGTFYQDDDHKLQVSAQYNVVGPRIALVGDRVDNFSVIDRQRHVVDLSVTKGLGQHLELRAGIQDLLNQAVRQSWDLNRDNKINRGTAEENTHFGSFRRGQYSTLGLTYRL